MEIRNMKSQQNFGMALRVTPEAKELLRARRMPDKDIKKLGELIRIFENKKTAITINQRNNILKSEISLPGKHYSYTYEGVFARLFHSPIKFIAKACKKAEAVDNYFNHNKLDSII